MSINQISNANSYYKTTDKSSVIKKADSVATEEKEVAVVYEKENSVRQDRKIYQRDTETIAKLKEDAEQRTKHLRDLVEKMMLKQGKTLSNATNIYDLLREGKLDIDEDTRTQAQMDIAEDGYWGVNQTAERLVSFAKALSGGDPSKADILIEAVQKGFSEATKAWGGELPSICKDTVEATIKELEKWRDSIGE